MRTSWSAERLCVCPLQGALLGIEEVFTPSVAAAAVELSGGCDPEVARNADRIYAELRAEELRFRKTLAQGRRVLADMLQVGLPTCRALRNLRSVAGCR